MMKNVKYLALLILMMGMFSCHEDEYTNTTGETNTPSPTVTLATTGDVLGYVYDEEGNPVSGASVTVLDEATTTDSYGVFKFNDIELDQNGSYLTVTKAGYILGSDMIYAQEDVQHTSRVRLLSLATTGTLQSGDGGSINVEGGGTVVFAPNSIAREDGSSYSGEVKVTAKRIATDSPYLGDMMPGALVAEDNEGRTVALGSMGMVAVELRDNSGNELNLASGSTAQITFPIAAGQQAGAPDEIQLWSFDEARGVWVQEGTAVKDGNSYRGTVSHFSFWNCDAPFPLTTICGKVLYENGQPANQATVTILAGSFGAGSSWTNSDGSFGGKVPKNRVLTLIIYDSFCNDDSPTVEIEIGPFTTKTVLDDIIIPLPSDFSLTGEVMCMGNPVAGASVLYSYEDNTYVIESDDEGAFSIFVGDQCDGIDEISLFAIDPANGMASITQTASSNASPITLEVCNDCNFTVTIEQDNTVDICQQKILNAQVDGNGYYSYEWSTGDTSSSIELGSQSGQYCVTVTEVDLECSMAVCSDEQGFWPLNGELGSASDCQGSGGLIFVYVGGGYPPYTYEWSDPSLVVLNDSIVENVPEGMYTVTVTDSKGCTKIMDTEVGAGTLSVEIDINSGCGYSELTAIVSGSDNYQITWDNPNGSQGGSYYVYENGEYCVTVTNELGCLATECVIVDIQEISDIASAEVTGCSEGTYTITNTSLEDFTVFLWFGNQLSYEIEPGQSEDINLIDNGFFINWVSVYSNSLGCEGEISIDVPYAFPAQDSGIVLDLLFPTCTGCTDGGVVINTDAVASMNGENGAVPGVALILNSDFIDVTTEATNNQIGAGLYYAVVTDVNTGCYIYSERIVLE